MKFVYLLLADAVNATADGKTNILGAGVREVNTRDFPVNVPLAVAGRVEGSAEETGEFRLLVTINGPGKKRAVIVDEPAVPLGGRAPSDGPLAALDFQIGMMLHLEEAGDRTVRVSYGSTRASWKFTVNPAQETATGSTAG